MNRRNLIIVCVIALALVAGGVLYLLPRDDAQGAPALQAAVPIEALQRFHSPVIGATAAPVTIVEFFDPACEACRAFYPYVKEIIDTHPGQVRLMIRYTPFHGDISVEAIRILEAARAQGRFEAVLEALLAGQSQWARHGAPSSEKAWELALGAGLDLQTARAHIATGAPDRLLEQDVNDVKAVRISQTPTFFVNGQPLPTPVPRVLLELVQAELAK